MLEAESEAANERGNSNAAAKPNSDEPDEYGVVRTMHGDNACFETVGIESVIYDDSRPVLIVEPHIGAVSPPAFLLSMTRQQLRQSMAQHGYELAAGDDSKGKGESDSAARYKGSTDMFSYQQQPVCCKASYEKKDSAESLLDIIEFFGPLRLDLRYTATAVKKNSKQKKKGGKKESETQTAASTQQQQAFMSDLLSIPVVHLTAQLKAIDRGLIVDGSSVESDVLICHATTHTVKRRTASRTTRTRCRLCAASAASVWCGLSPIAKQREKEWR